MATSKEAYAKKSKAEMFHILRREILAARLKTTLDQELKRPTSDTVRRLAAMKLPPIIRESEPSELPQQTVDTVGNPDASAPASPMAVARYIAGLSERSTDAPAVTYKMKRPGISEGQPVELVGFFVEPHSATPSERGEAATGSGSKKLK